MCVCARAYVSRLVFPLTKLQRQLIYFQVLTIEIHMYIELHFSVNDHSTRVTL